MLKKTFVFIGPILPGNPERLIQDLHGIADRILIDRMNYLHSISGFYRQLGFEDKMTDNFFNKAKERFTAALKEREMRFELLF